MFRRPKLLIFGGLGLAWSLLGNIGNLQTARDIFDNRGPIMNWVGRVLFGPWGGATLALGCLVSMLVLRWQEMKRFNYTTAEKVSMPLQPNSTLTMMHSMGARFQQSAAARPAVVLRYESLPFGSIPDADKTHEEPLLIQNGGEKPAREIAIDPLILSGHIVRFEPPDTLLPNEGKEVTVSVEHAENGSNTGNSLGAALANDFWHRAWKNDQTADISSPLSLRYRDFTGTAYDDVFDLAYNRSSRRITLRLRSQR